MLILHCQHCLSLWVPFPRCVCGCAIALWPLNVSQRHLRRACRAARGSSWDRGIAVPPLHWSGNEVGHAAAGTAQEKTDPSPSPPRPRLPSARSDIYGERCCILGGVHGAVESLFRRYTRDGMRSVLRRKLPERGGGRRGRGRGHRLAHRPPARCLCHCMHAASHVLLTTPASHTVAC